MIYRVHYWLHLTQGFFLSLSLSLPPLSVRRTHKHPYRPTHVHAFIYTRTPSRAFTRTHKHACIHPRVHARTHTVTEKQHGSKCLTAIKHYKKCFYRSLIFNQESCAWRGTASFLVATTARIQPGTHTLVLVVRQHQHQPPGLLLWSQSMKMCVSMRMHYTGE